MIERILPQEHKWLASRESQLVMEALSPSGQAARARYVGGCVRDALLGHIVNDIDIATQLCPEEIIQCAKKKGLQAIPTGITHGTITLISGSASFEVTSLRKDIKTDGRYAEVSFTQDWSLDASRRDFTINAIYADRQGHLYNPCLGIEHLLEKKVCFIGEAFTRIQEDYLRILRFFRFSARYGEGMLNPQGLEACSALCEGLRKISVERIWQELKKTLAVKDPRSALKGMEETGVLKVILPEVISLERFIKLVSFDLEQSGYSETLVRLYALLPDSVTVIKKIAKRLKISSEERKRLLNLQSLVSNAVEPLTENQLMLWLYKGLKQEAVAFLHLKAAFAKEREKVQYYQNLALELQRRKIPVFPVSAKDLLDRGGQQGKLLGEALNILEKTWIKSRFKTDRKDLLSLYEEIRLSQRLET